ncbi:MAG: STAS domain-containing protein [Microthrixaceae bacterium]
MSNDDPSIALQTAHTVHLTGDYDVARQDELRTDLLASTDDVVVADLRDVSFLDSSAIHAFVDARNQLAAAGRSIQLINLTGMPRRVFDITGLTPLFTSPQLDG